MTSPKIISVVRDFNMYERCLRKNPNAEGCDLVPIDNRRTNDHIGTCYNRALDSLDPTKPTWLVFCHEDFEPQEPLVEVLADLDLTSIYGPIGAITVRRFGIYYQWRLVGTIEESAKSGQGVGLVGTSTKRGTQADTLDCQCLIVHSSLIEKYHLRFDENLSFDLYAEDFCIMAKERHGILSIIVPFKCHHWSRGSVQARYFTQLNYLNAKWPNAAYTGTATQLIGGGGSILWRSEVAIKRLIQRLTRRALGLVSA